MKINKTASRGGLDLSQYAVVPWVVNFTSSK